MNPTVDELASQARHLSPDERERLLERILVMQCEQADPAVDQAWKEEVERRIDAIDRGEETLHPWEEVRKDLGL